MAHHDSLAPRLAGEPGRVESCQCPRQWGLALDFFQTRDSHCPRSTGGGTESEGNLWVQILFAEDWWSSVGKHRRETTWKDYEGNTGLKPAPFPPGYTALWGSCLVPLSSNKAKRGSEGQPTSGWLSCQQ